jgi:DNA-binding IclR family transcriptional regulator
MADSDDAEALPPTIPMPETVEAPLERGLSPPIRSLSKGLSALDLLRKSGELRTGDLATLLGIDKGGASRILQTLTQAGYAGQVPGRRYAPGPKLDGRGTPAQLRVPVRLTARPLLVQLAEMTGEAVYLGILADDQVLYLDKEIPPSTLKVERPIPTLSPIYCTAIGKVFMAYGLAPIPDHMPASTPKTVTDPRLLAQELRRVRADGFSHDDEEFNIGIRCVAAPLFDPAHNVVGVLSIAAPTARFSGDQIEAMGKAVKRVADMFGKPER